MPLHADCGDHVLDAVASRAERDVQPPTRQQLRAQAAALTDSITRAYVELPGDKVNESEAMRSLLNQITVAKLDGQLTLKLLLHIELASTHIVNGCRDDESCAQPSSSISHAHYITSSCSSPSSLQALCPRTSTHNVHVHLDRAPAAIPGGSIDSHSVI